MNKAITEGAQFMPPAFSDGLGVWANGNGTPGSDTYAAAANAAFVPADQDFGGCLEIQKSSSVQKLRYIGETPILPGCYLRITARIKAMSGNLASIRIAGWAGAANGDHVSGLTEVGPTKALTSYGEIVEVSAIVGTGKRSGVDMVWGREPRYGHFGIDLTGQNGGVVRIEDITIEDVTSVFLRDMLAMVDVRDFGAIGDGLHDDTPAFEAADAAAGGKWVMVPEGAYFLNDSLTMESRMKFEGTVVMPDDKILSLTRNFELDSYIDAFGDEELAFKKAFQALFNNSDHESLDLCGRRISLSGPIDMQAALANRTTYAQRRHIRNGQFQPIDGPAWDNITVTSQASYSPSDPNRLTNVTNVVNIPVGSLIEGNGVGREVYVRSKNVAAQEITLSLPLHDAAGTQNYTFTRFQYLLDFSNFDHLDKFSMSDIEFQCAGTSSAILLPPSGLIFHLRDCFITRPKNRGITSHGKGCQGMLIDRCQFLSDESALLSQERISIGLNTNANDVKLRNNRVVHFRHFAIMAGSGSIITGNHWFQGDSAQNAIRLAGIVLSRTNCRASINGNYIDNSFVEWANEHDPAPEFASELSFSGLNITDNICLASDVAPWFSFFVIKPHGAGHFINGMTLTGNIFRNINGNIDRPERVDTSFADLDYRRMRNITFTSNMYNQVSVQVQNPLVIEHSQTTPAASWMVECAPKLPFGGRAITVESVTPIGAITTSSNTPYYGVPYAQPEQGANRDQIHLRWEKSLMGKAVLRVRCDNLF